MIQAHETAQEAESRFSLLPAALRKGQISGGRSQLPPSLPSVFLKVYPPPALPQTPAQNFRVLTGNTGWRDVRRRWEAGAATVENSVEVPQKIKNVNTR